MTYSNRATGCYAIPKDDHAMYSIGTEQRGLGQRVRGQFRTIVSLWKVGIGRARQEKRPGLHANSAKTINHSIGIPSTMDVFLAL